MAIGITVEKDKFENFKKDFEEYAGEFIIKPPGKPTLVQEQDKRPAITNKVTAEEAFSNEEIKS